MPALVNSDYMVCMIEREQILEVGYCQVPFGMPEIQRADYTSAASKVIDLAVSDMEVHEALTFSLLPDFKGRVNPTLFTVSGALNSADDKTWLHAGYRTQEFASEKIPERNQPRELRDLWSPLRAMLYEVEKAGRATFDAIGSSALSDIIFHPDLRKRVVLIRTVKYHDALSGQIGAEMVAGHADQSLASLHLYETHGGWFQAAPYPQRLMLHEDTDERAEEVAAIRDRLVPIANDHEHEAAFFLGVGVSNLPEDLKKSLEDLPAAYHAGRKPAPRAEVASIYANDVSDTDRVSTIAFAHPNTDVLTAGDYQIASVSQCRPAYTSSL